MARLSTETRHEVVILHQQGLSQAKISKQTGVSRCAVQALLKKHKETGNVEDRRRSGRPRKLSAADEIHIMFTSLQNRKMSSSAISSEVAETSGTQVHPSTVRRSLARSGLHGRIMSKKPYLQHGNKAKRFNYVFTMSSVKGTVGSDERREFCSFFDQIVQDLTVEDLGHPEIGDAILRLKRVLEYTVSGGKCNRGMTVLASFLELVRPELQKDENIQRALAVGWCVELLQAFFLVADDIMDNSVTRRGQPCWYKKEGIGLDAINDSLMLEACVYRVLRKYCRQQPYYLQLLELFLETSYQTELGQALDLITAAEGKVDLEHYTEGRYKSIAKYKTAFCSFYMPVAAAMYMAGIDGEDDHRNAKSILMEMGEFFQIQDDYLDCYGDPSVTGKIGTDIQDNKCSWLVVEALKRVNPEQRQILQENYGQDDAEKVQRVKQLYDTLELPAVYSRYEEKSYQRLQTLTSQLANGLSKEIFLGLARKIYKRQK
ncbi:farnesyl pyrophosphate synthase-like isoform X1 [Eleutherodactylus coqui]|uniref:farnesyl pyrophosphate synthase-like isoform X1 n=2 Tax=Eleutherodactylus coqui TaxID=57060 RepID=UPI00346242E0